MTISVAKSDYFMARARRICLSRTHKNKSTANYFSESFLDVYILSAMALEAFINERISIDLTLTCKRIALKRPDVQGEENQTYLDPHQKEVLEMLKDQDIRTKYRMMPILLWRKGFDEGRSPFQDFVTLVEIRNDIIHYKMPFYDEQDKRPKWVDRLKAKRIFLTEPVVRPPEPLPYEGHRVWIDEICTFEGARWAYNTSCAMIKKFVELSEGLIEVTCHPWVDSLTPI